MNENTNTMNTTTKILHVHQLTAREAAQVMDDIQNGWRPHAIDILMDGQSELPSPLIFAATGTDYDSFPLDISPDDLPSLYEQVEQANPFLSKSVRAKVVRALDVMKALQEKALERIINGDKKTATEAATA